MAQAKLDGMRILLAEDDQDLRECIAENLGLYGAEVVAAENGAKALELYNQTRIDAVVSDFRMPGGDGLGLLKAIRARDPKNPPFVFLTGYSDITGEEAKEQGAQGFVHKPCDFQQLAVDLLELFRKR